MASLSTNPVNVDHGLRPLAFGMLAVACWSLTATLATYVGNLNNIPLVVALTQLVALAAMITAHAIWREKGPKGHVTSRKRPFSSFGIDLSYCISYLAYQYCLYFSIGASHPFSANALNYLWPLLLPFFISFSTTVRQPASILTLVAAFGASIVTFYGGRGGFAPADSTLGLCAGVAAAILAATYMTLGNRIHRKTIHFTHYLAFFRRVYFYGFLISAILAALIYGTGQLKIDRTDVVIAILAGLSLGLLSLSFANICWQVGLTESIRSGHYFDIPVLAFLIPPFSAVFLVLFGRMPPSSFTWGMSLGSIVIFSLVAISVDRATRLTAGMWAFLSFFALTLILFSLKKFVLPVYPLEIEEVHKSLNETTFLGLITLFAVLAAFMLQRSWDKAQQEASLALQISQVCKDLYCRGIDVSAEDAFYVATCIKNYMDDFYLYLCARRRDDIFERGERVKERQKQVHDAVVVLSSEETSLKLAVKKDFDSKLDELSKAFNLLAIRRCDGFSFGQTIILGGIGLVSIAYLIFQFPSNIFAIYIVVLASSGIVYIAALTRDLARQGAFSSIEAVFLITSVYTELFKVVLIPNRSYGLSAHISRSAAPYQLQYIEVSDDRAMLPGNTQQDLKNTTTLRRLIYSCLGVGALMTLVVMYAFANT